MNYLKSVFNLGVILLLLAGASAFSQHVIVKSNIVPYENDYVRLVIDEVRGDIHWEVSTNKVNWTTIPGNNSTTLDIQVNRSAYYRAVITEGSCNPIYSDTALVAVLYDDRDGQVYNIIKIGKQWWMAENLNYYTENGSWYYQNDSVLYANDYGRLYNWNTAVNICPDNWHLPSDDEWKILEMELGISISDVEGIDWRGTDEGVKLMPGGSSGFDAQFGGYRALDGYFSAGGIISTFWTSVKGLAINEYWYRGLHKDSTAIHRYSWSDDYAFSVRCIRDDVPFVITDSVDQITKNSAVSGGIIMSDMGSAILAKGICWSTNQNPTIADNYTDEGSGTDAFISTITGLTPNTTYYIRTYATNEKGVGYGNEFMFSTPANLPEVVTAEVTSITTTSAVTGGYVTENAEINVTARGVCWGLSHNPSLQGNYTVNGSGAGSFVSSLYGLKPNTTYYIRAYATCSDGTAYGEEISFETLPVNETDSYVDTRDGHTYKTVKIGNHWWMAENLDYYTGSGSFYFDDDSINYAVYGRLYNWSVANSVCSQGWHLPTDNEWKTLEITIGMSPGEANITGWRGTGQATDLIEGGSSGFDALYGGLLHSDGNYYNAGSIATFWSATEYNMSGDYWYRGLNSARTDIHRYYYSDEYGHSVRCIKNNIPEIVTDSIGSVTESSAYGYGNVIFNGGASVIERGVCWNTSTNPVRSDNHATSGAGTGTFTVEISSLIPNTTYYARAYAINSEGIAYGNEISFTTEMGIPEITTSPVTSITSTSAISGGTGIKDNGFPILSKGVCWNKTGNPTISNNHTNNGSGKGTFVSSITGLSPNTTYYVRAYATNSQGTGYGQELEFKTLPLNETGTVNDSRDGKTYNTIRIDDQWWMAENLNYSTGSGSWNYDDLPGNGDLYGRLYNWATANAVCLSGWHLSSDYEWKMVEMELGMSEAQADGTDWRGTNEGTKLMQEGSSGFDALLAGYRDPGGVFNALGTIGTFWTSGGNLPAGEHWYRGVNISDTRIHRDNWSNSYAFSVRCAENSTPVVFTESVSSITDSSASIEYTVEDGRGVNVTARGICWSKTHIPDLGDDHTNDGTGLGTFVSELTGLDPNTTYYVRAYATNSKGTAYGDEVGFTTEIGLPELTTVSVISITDSSAISGGNITDNGGAPINERGVCWSTSHGPTTSDDHTNDGTGSGMFISSITGLDPNTTYYVRAYAINSAGTAYGNELSFKTVFGLPRVTTSSVSSVTDSSAACGGNVTYDGGLTVTARGVCWSTSHNPDIGDDHTNNGTGTGVFESLLTGLAPNMQYYVRAYATNSQGTSYGNEVGFSTAVGLPQVTTASVTSITDNSATSGGTVTSTGGTPVTARGVCWSTSQNPDINDDHTTNGSGLGSFVSAITGLSPNTTYYVRAYATNSAGTGYGNQVSFTTITGLPKVTTSSVSSIADVSASCGGNVTSDGGLTVTTRGVCWSTSQDPDINDDHTSDGTGTGAFTSSITGLTPGTGYYVRAYATNTNGTAYGNQVSFTTTSTLATITTASIGSVTINSATGGGNVTNEGGTPVTARGVCWSTSTNPTIADNTTSDGSGPGVFVSSLSGLTASTEYFVRAYATNSAGTAYGNEVSFRTLNETGTLEDIRDGQIYNTVRIGDQWWMAENLNFYTAAGSWYYGDDSTAYAETYGRLYMWDTVMAGEPSSNTNPSGVQGVCPSGWHIPSDAEWAELITELGGSTVAGGKMKEEGSAHWNNPVSGATNESGFTGLPAGERTDAAVYQYLGERATCWSATESGGGNAWTRILYNNNNQAEKVRVDKEYGLSVRCVKD